MRFRQTDIDHYNYHTNPCTVYVRILYHHHLIVINSFDYHVDYQIKFINEMI